MTQSLPRTNPIDYRGQCQHSGTLDSSSGRAGGRRKVGCSLARNDSNDAFPRWRIDLAVELGGTLLRYGLWIAKHSPKMPMGGSVALRDIWIAFVPRYVSQAIPPISRVVGDD